jgi:agmatinase
MGKTEQQAPNIDYGFDPDGVGVRNGNFFGMPYSPDDAKIVLISVPWDVTTSYGDGAAAAPAAIIEASTQLDFYDPWAPGEWRGGIATLPVDSSTASENARLRPEAKKIIEALESGAASEPGALAQINAASAELNRKVETETAAWLAKGKIVGLVGGDHSTPLGLVQALGAHFEQRGERFGVLHLDAHCDLREKYEGFDHSHASIMYNVLVDVPQIERLVQVGVRDFSETELETARRNPKIVLFTGAELAEAQFAGVSWAAQCDDIVATLPQNVYISFDIDFLSPEFCPSTGTPVPGGRSFDEAAYLLRRVADSGRRIVGFDLCEVAPRIAAATTTADAAATDAAAPLSDPARDFDASVGARILFKLCGQALRAAKSSKRIAT